MTKSHLEHIQRWAQTGNSPRRYTAQSSESFLLTPTVVIIRSAWGGSMKWKLRHFSERWSLKACGSAFETSCMYLSGIFDRFENFSFFVMIGRSEVKKVPKSRFSLYKWRWLFETQDEGGVYELNLARFFGEASDSPKNLDSCSSCMTWDGIFDRS